MNSKTAPKVVMSHASEDKPDFAEPLSRLLRERHIDAWLDKWEIRPGDSLVRRIFEEAIGKADAVVVLLSKTSVAKPWVQAELDLSVVRRIEEGIRLIPVIVEECDVPQSLRATLYIDLQKVGSLAAVADLISNALHGISARPPLGPKPAHLTMPSLGLRGLTKTDEAILQLLHQQALPDDRTHVDVRNSLPIAMELGITEEAYRESIEILVEEGYLGSDIKLNDGEIICISIPPRMFLMLSRAAGTDVELAQRQVAALILNEDVRELDDISKRLSLPTALTQAIVDSFADQGYLQKAWPLGVSAFVTTTTTSFKRWLRENS